MALQTHHPLVSWYPHRLSNFVVVNRAGLRYYKIVPTWKVKEKEFVDGQVDFAIEGGNGTKSIDFLSGNSEIHNARCLEWCPVDTASPLLAIGKSQGGNTSLVRLDTEHRFSPVIKSFGGLPERSVTALSWNKVRKQHLAAALERQRGYAGVQVWDVESGMMVFANFCWRASTGSSTSVLPEQPTTSTIHGMQGSHPGANRFELSSKPLAVSSITRSSWDLALGEGGTAVEWNPNDPWLLVIGTQGRYLRMYDLRADTTTPHVSVSAHAKTFKGVSFDPFDSFRLLTYSKEDGHINIWDVRRLTVPIRNFMTKMRPLQQVEWCPTRRSVVATTSIGGAVLNLHDVDRELQKEDSLPSYERFAWAGGRAQMASRLTEQLRVSGVVSQTPAKGNTSVSMGFRTHTMDRGIGHFAWHLKKHSHILLIDLEGSRAEVVSLLDAPPFAWMPRGGICLGRGKKVTTMEAPADMGALMMSRAKLGYGVNLSLNYELADGCEEVKALWSLMKRMQLEEHTSPSQHFAQGLYSLLVDHPMKSVEEMPKDNLIRFTIYRSEARRKALRLCGWGFDTTALLDEALEELAKTDRWEQAATLALFHLDLSKAIDYLNRGGQARAAKGVHVQNNLRLVAIALAGYSPEMEQGLWHKMCGELHQQFQHPYLRASFAMLSSQDHQWDSLLLDDKLLLRDRLAFATRYLPDDRLVNYIRKMTRGATREGDLHGILATGMTGMSVDLFENYVARTGDVQTAGLALGFVVPREFEDPRAQVFLEEYRVLLDRSKLCILRAEMDISMRELQGSHPEPIPIQVVARCNFCQQVLTHRKTQRGGGFAGYISYGGGRSAARKPKITACPSCRKPLPSCAVCLLRMGTPNNVGEARPRKGDVEGDDGTLDQWFTWCQTCRHGGHFEHMQDWFASHYECPVADCLCRCNSLDV